MALCATNQPFSLAAFVLKPIFYCKILYILHGWLVSTTHDCGRLWLCYHGCGAGRPTNSTAVQTSSVLPSSCRLVAGQPSQPAAAGPALRRPSLHRPHGWLQCARRRRAGARTANAAPRPEKNWRDKPRRTGDTLDWDVWARGLPRKKTPSASGGTWQSQGNCRVRAVESTIFRRLRLRLRL